ncbi:hypothetical protein [Desulfurobacterium crinifex]
MTRRELEHVRKQYRSVKVLVTMEVLFHLLPSFVSLFLPEPYDAWGILWLMFGGLVILVIYNLIALIFGLERGFPILGSDGGNGYYSRCNDPDNMYYDPGCPESPYYEDSIRY